MPRLVDHEERRHQLTEATAREIERVGLGAVRLRDVARAAGWTTGAVTHYFADKRELLLATFRSRTELAHARFEAAVAAGGAMVDAKLDAVLPLDRERLLNWKVWLAFWGAAVGDAELAAEQRHRYETFRSGLEEAVRADQAAGLISCDVTAADLARQLATLLDGIAVQVVFAPDIWPPEEQRRLVAGYLASLGLRHSSHASWAGGPPVETGIAGVHRDARASRGRVRTRHLTQ
jgi:AcrR family transcriptional regulator